MIGRAAIVLHGYCGAGLVSVDEEVGVGGEVAALGVGEGWGACVERAKGVVDEILDLGGAGGVAGGEVGMPSESIGRVEAAVDEVVIGRKNGR